MTFIRLTKRQFRLASLVVVVAMLMNIAIPGLAALALDHSCANPDPTVITNHNKIDGHGMWVDDDPTITYEDSDNSEPNPDNLDDCTLMSVTFSIARGKYFGPVVTRSFIGQNPAPAHRPPDRR
ncbi:MAG: C-type lectin domain-containing protein [Methylococcales bacterium]